MTFWRKPKKAEEALRAAAEIAGDQLAPGAGKWLLIVGGIAAGAAAAYIIARNRKSKGIKGQLKGEAVLHPAPATIEKKAARKDGLFKFIEPRP